MTIFKRHLQALCLGTFILGVTFQASGEDCSDCPPLSPTIITQQGCEYELDGWHCQASIFSHTAEFGLPGERELMKTVTCIACNSEGGTVTWSKTYQWTVSFCITVGVGVKWSIPLGGEWSVQGSTTLCYEQSESEMIQVEITCGSDEIRHAHVYRQPVPVTFTDVIRFDKIGEYELAGGGTPGCAETYESGVPCETSERESESTTYQFLVEFEDEECPPSWPEG